MKMKVSHCWVWVLMSLFNASCSEFQEPQIDGERVEIFVPRDSLRTDVATQLFYWYPVEGAEKYELQIVTPSFSRVDRLVLDTNISGHKFEFNLQPGDYEWSIRAYNFTSSTDYTVHSLFIDTSLDLSGQKVIPIQPLNNDTSNLGDKIFEWQGLYNAEGYHFELWASQIGEQLVHSRNTASDTLHVRDLNEGGYTWRVRGVNDLGQTDYSSRSFFIDTTRPAKPNLLSPPQGQFFNSTPIDFSWSHPTNNGSSVRDTFILAEDSLLTKVRRRIYTLEREVTIDTLTDGIYYWGVRPFDRAGNRGVRSSVRQFTLK